MKSEEIFKNFVALSTVDENFKQYIDSKCDEAVSETKSYIEKECSGNYDEQELSVMRERLIFLKALSLMFANKEV